MVLTSVVSRPLKRFPNGTRFGTKTSKTTKATKPNAELLCFVILVVFVAFVPERLPVLPAEGSEVGGWRLEAGSRKLWFAPQTGLRYKCPVDSDLARIVFIEAGLGFAAAAEVKHARA